MFCPECGTKNEDGALFCEECGTSLKEYMESPPQQQQAQWEIPPQQQQQAHWEIPPQQGGGNIPRPAAKPLSMLLIAVILEVIFAAGLILGIYKVIDSRVSPESVAMAYWKAEMNHDWGKAYDCCDFPESDLLTKQMYVNVKANDDETVKYSSVHISEVNPDVDLNAQVGDKSAKEYVIEYRTKGNSEKDYSYLTLTKTGKKHFLFWDEWRVTSSDSWCKDIQFQVPEGASVTLNGVAVQGKEETEDAWKYITIPYLFVGDYQMEVSGDGFEPYRKVINVTSYGCEDAYVELRFSEETIKKLAEQAAGDIKTIMENAVAGNNFNSVQELFSKKALSDGDVQSQYEELLEIRGNGSAGDMVTLNLQNFVSTVDEEITPDRIYMNVTADMEETYWGYWNDGSIETNSGQLRMYVNYVKEDGFWKLVDIPVSYYDF